MKVQYFGSTNILVWIRNHILPKPSKRLNCLSQGYWISPTRIPTSISNSILLPVGIWDTHHQHVDPVQAPLYGFISTRYDAQLDTHSTNGHNWFLFKLLRTWSRLSDCNQSRIKYDKPALSHYPDTVLRAQTDLSIYLLSFF
ncbi:158f31ef-6fc0-4897-ae8c-e7a05f48c161 [Sclerotinia trifoliorum]|uniref:158f31ef-6fc0-4897-ae8c-e7a05f48c161 n=1 Tax=Sclerotinia trifoliorum TaxID=28548 RepID=A0A8H2VWZ4_9HELO|nr:158f31ef-6fc0-4897-ae8c-e7a05f48c161 [Sclerotinia trifoliorum]